MAHLGAIGWAFKLKQYIRPIPNPSGGVPALSTPYSGKIAGVVREGATPVAGTKVHLYYRANGQQIASVRSDQYGVFSFSNLDQTLLENYFLVALDPDGGAQYNAQVYDRLTAVTDLTRTVVSNGFEDSLFGTSSATYGG